MTAPQEKRRKNKGPLVVTANRLWDGAVVYRTADGTWSTELPAARIVTSPEDAERLLESALADERHAIGAYAAPVTQDSGVVVPANLREHIRRNGPTIALPSPRVSEGSANVRL